MPAAPDGGLDVLGSDAGGCWPPCCGLSCCVDCCPSEEAMYRSWTAPMPNCCWLSCCEKPAPDSPPGVAVWTAGAGELGW